MHACGSLVILNGSRENVRTVGDVRTRFQHSENVGNHYQHRDSIDNYNPKRHDSNTHEGISLENYWKKIRWSVRVFSFVIAVTLVNFYLIFIYFNDRKEKKSNTTNLFLMRCALML